MHAYQVLGDDRYLQEADKILSWLNDTKIQFSDGTAAWPVAIDPQDDDPADIRVNNHRAAGIEEGNAGIAWALLQSYNVLHQKNDPRAEQYLTLARQATDRLLKVAIKGKNGQLSWREYQNPNSPLIHANLDNGAAGIDIVLMDMYQATGDRKYLTAAQGGQRWLIATAIHKDGMVSWKDADVDEDGNVTHFANGPEWHWSGPGIVASMIRVAGGRIDMPGEQSALVAVK